MPLDFSPLFADPDEDLTLTPIDEWAGGVLPVRNSDASTLRCSVTPLREVRKAATLKRIVNATELPKDEPKERPKAATRPPPARTSKPKQPVVVVVSEAERIMKAFEEARKRTNSQMKAITVDSDLSVIPIAEPKGLPPALIVPKLTTRPKGPPKPVVPVVASRPRRMGVNKSEPRRRRKQPPPLLEPDVPAFDEEVALISYSDKFVCSPGVTFKDGSTVKSRPQVTNASQLTRAQYEVYLEEMMRGDGA
jgi:hypothetical protein